MRSTLKKSLYLGLAALSFASVAGVANNANAAKKSHHVKHAKTYAKASYINIPNQGNSNIAYNVTGSNAMFNKPGTVKGAKQTVSKQTMSNLASAKENFMVYQKATTDRGSHYIKAVSFDKKYRGWIYAGNNNSTSYGTGVNQINLDTPTTQPTGNVYLKTPGQTALKSTPEGAQFNASYDNFSHTGFVAKDAFTVDAAQTVSKTGTTWYHLVDQKDNTINGWVPNTQVQNNSNNNYFDKNNDVKINYISNGNVIADSYIPADQIGQKSGFASGILDSSKLGTLINENITGTNSEEDASTAINNANANTNSNHYGITSPLYNKNYKLSNAINGSTDNNLQIVRTGDTVNVSVDPISNGNVSSKLSLKSIDGSSINANDVYMPKLSFDQQNALQGAPYQYISSSSLDNDIFNTNAAANNNSGVDKNQNGLFYSNNDNYNEGLGTIYGKDQTATHDMNNGDIKNQSTFHYEYRINIPASEAANSNVMYGQPINAYYDKFAVKGSVNNTHGINNNTNPIIANTDYLNNN